MATAVNERVDALLASGDAAAHCLVGATCDDAELACAGPIPEDWPRALQILGHLATGALVEAHLAWCRVPEPLRASDAELVAAKALLDALRRRDLAHLLRLAPQRLLGRLALRLDHRERRHLLLDGQPRRAQLDRRRQTSFVT